MHQGLMIQHSMQWPHPVSGDLDQPDAGLFQPIRDPLGLLDTRSRQRIRWFWHSLSGGSHGSRDRLRHLMWSRESGPGQPAVTDDVYLPIEVNLSRGDDLLAHRKAADAVEASGGTRQGFQPPADDGCFLEPLLTDQPAQPRLHAE